LALERDRSIARSTSSQRQARGPGLDPADARSQRLGGARGACTIVGGGPTVTAPDPSGEPRRRRERKPSPPGWINRFSGKLVLVLLDNKFAPSTKGGRSLWGLQRPLTYRPSDADFDITVPAGFVTDLASIPRWAWTLLPPDGPWVKAAIIHDFLYATGGTGVWKGHASGATRPGPYSRKESDWILRDAMENRGVGVIRRTIIWVAVRIGGWWGWTRMERPTPSEADEAYVTETEGF